MYQELLAFLQVPHTHPNKHLFLPIHQYPTFPRSILKSTTFRLYPLPVLKPTPKQKDQLFASRSSAERSCSWNETVINILIAGRRPCRSNEPVRWVTFSVRPSEDLHAVVLLACYRLLRNLFIFFQGLLVKSRGNSYIREEILHRCGLYHLSVLRTGCAAFGQRSYQAFRVEQ